MWWKLGVVSKIVIVKFMNEFMNELMIEFMIELMTEFSRVKFVNSNI